MTGAKRTQAAQVLVAPERPSPRETPPRRDPNEESPESRRLFGAVWGAQPQRTPRGKHDKADMFTQRRAHAAPPSPFSASLRTPSGSPQRNAQARSEPSKFDNRMALENALRRSRPTRNRNGTYRKPSCLALMRQTAGVIEHKTFQQERMTDANEHKTSQ